MFKLTKLNKQNKFIKMINFVGVVKYIFGFFKHFIPLSSYIHNYISNSKKIPVCQRLQFLKSGSNTFPKSSDKYIM